MASSYGQKLKDPRWQKRRLKILERDEWKCQICGDATSTLHVHHRWYEPGKEPWDVPDNALVTLCETCHVDEGEMRPQVEQAVLRTLRERLDWMDAVDFAVWLRKVPQDHLLALIKRPEGSV